MLCMMEQYSVLNNFSIDLGHCVDELYTVDFIYLCMLIGSYELNLSIMVF